MGGADLRFYSPQPDTNLCCETTDTGLVHRVVCLFTYWYQVILPGDEAHGDEQLAQGCYSTARRPGLELASPMP